MLWLRNLNRLFIAFVFFAFLSACTDYVEQIDSQIDEYNAHERAFEESTMRTADYYVEPKSTFEGTLEDSRDGRVYKTVTIGSQTWMAENLNFEVENSYCYNDDSENCVKYGRLYTWATAMDSAGKWNDCAKGCGYGKICVPTYPVRGVCPDGWHVPSYGEWETLRTAVGGNLDSTIIWDNNIAAEYDYGFTVLPAGAMIANGKYSYEGKSTFFWTSSEQNKKNAISYYLHGRGGEDYFIKSFGYSVRCVKDVVEEKPVESSSSQVAESSSSEIEKGSFTDERDGKSYKTVAIGDQVWMAENLNYKVYPSYCFDNEESNCELYGRLYAWGAAMSACPSGWHLPSKDEFETLLSAVGGQEFAGKKLKSSEGWNGDGNGTDAYGFSALPACKSQISGSCDGIGYCTHFWSSTIADDVEKNPYTMYLYHDKAKAFLASNWDREEGYSVRCVKGTSSSSVASSSSEDTESSSSEEEPRSSVESSSSFEYIDMEDFRDGKVYKAICIPGSQCWMAENINYEMEGSYCYDDADSNCTVYGRLYTWESAKKVCPAGWHLPSKGEYDDFVEATGEKFASGKALKASCDNGWRWSGCGSDSYGFTALPAGIRTAEGSYKNLYEWAFFWSDTEYDSESAYYMDLSDNDDNAYVYHYGKGAALSVRCVMN